MSKAGKKSKAVMVKVVEFRREPNKNHNGSNPAVQTVNVPLLQTKTNVFIAVSHNSLVGHWHLIAR